MLRISNSAFGTGDILVMNESKYLSANSEYIYDEGVLLAAAGAADDTDSVGEDRSCLSLAPN